VLEESISYWKRERERERERERKRERIVIIETYIYSRHFEFGTSLPSNHSYKNA